MQKPTTHLSPNASFPKTSSATKLMDSVSRSQRAGSGGKIVRGRARTATPYDRPSSPQPRENPSWFSRFLYIPTTTMLRSAAKVISAIVFESSSSSSSSGDDSDDGDDDVGDDFRSSQEDEGLMKTETKLLPEPEVSGKSPLSPLRDVIHASGSTRPKRKAAEKIQSYKEPSINVKMRRPKEDDSDDGDDDVGDDFRSSQEDEGLMKTETKLLPEPEVSGKSPLSPLRDVIHASGSTRPKRKAAEKIQSYKEPSINVKMRRPKGL